MKRITRRCFVQGVGLVTLPALFPNLSFAAVPRQEETEGDILVSIFLRGGADGLNMVVPYEDDNYYRNRPTLAIARPGGEANSAIDIDGFFGFHPAMAPLKALYDSGYLAVFPASGSHDDSHSHFDAQDFMDRGIPGDKTTDTGWIGRHLGSRKTGNSSSFRAVGVGDILQPSLRGPVPATALRSVGDFQLWDYSGRTKQFEKTLRALYDATGWLETQADQTFGAVNTLAQLDPGQYEPENGAIYPDDYFGGDLVTAAQLIKADIGVEAIAIDLGDWDTHEGQGSIGGWMAGNIDSLAKGLAAFYTDMGSRMHRITIVVMSEFGRRIDENASAGTDHGHGGLMLSLGGGITGGIYGNWPGLAKNNLYGPGDLAITTDFRTVLAEIVERRLLNSSISKVFPGFKAPSYLGFCE